MRLGRAVNVKKLTTTIPYNVIMVVNNTLSYHKKKQVS